MGTHLRSSVGAEEASRPFCSHVPAVIDIGPHGALDSPQPKRKLRRHDRLPGVTAIRDNTI